MILSHDPANQVAYPKPARYDPARFELFARLLDAMQKKPGARSRLGEVLSIVPIPNRQGRHQQQRRRSPPTTSARAGTTRTPPTPAAPRSGATTRSTPRSSSGSSPTIRACPPALQKEVNDWGLAKDEFTDTGNWPNQLYIREARRMVGEYVMIQKDLQTDLTKPDPIGMGSYNSDSHNVERIVDADGFVRNEGDMQVAVQPYQIPYRVMLPKRAEAQNLLVPVASRPATWPTARCAWSRSI